MVISLLLCSITSIYASSNQYNSQKETAFEKILTTAHELHTVIEDENVTELQKETARQQAHLDEESQNALQRNFTEKIIKNGKVSPEAWIAIANRNS